MKIGTNTYTWLWNESLTNTVKIIGEYGFKGIEFLVAPPHFHLSEYRPGMYKEIKKIMKHYGMRVLSVNIPGLDINVASPFVEMRNMTLEQYKRLTAVALELEAEVLLIVPGKRHPLLPPDYEYIHSLALETINKIIDYTKDTGLTLGVETVPAIFIDKVSQIKRLVKELDNERVKVVFDAANVYMQEDPAKALLEFNKEELCLLHLSDTKKSKWEHAPLGTGEVDTKAFIEAANKIEFDGYLALEVINDHGIKGIHESIEYLRAQGFKLEF